MNKSKVKILDLSILSNKQYQKYKNRLKDSHNKSLHIYDLDKQIITNNHIKGILIDDQDTVETIKYELTNTEKKEYTKIKKNIIKYSSLLKNEQDKLKYFENNIINNLNINENLYEGEYWNCCLSPIGRCIYHMDNNGELSCIFCGEPEERK